MKTSTAMTVGLLLWAAHLAAAEPQVPVDDRNQLAGIQWIVGDWKGVGQPRRGSTRGAWQEECEWVWKFDETGASLVVEAKNGKFLKNGELRWSESPGEFALKLQTEQSEASARIFHGKLDESGRLLLSRSDSTDGEPARISFRKVARGDRLQVLYEKRSSTGRFSRIAEVGYTRKGSGFGKGTGFVECVVTGGLGTIPVMHEGKTYYVCCTGCRDYFNEDPAAVLKEYRERKAEE